MTRTLEYAGHSAATNGGQVYTRSLAGPHFSSFGVFAKCADLEKRLETAIDTRHTTLRIDVREMSGDASVKFDFHVDTIRGICNSHSR